MHSSQARHMDCRSATPWTGRRMKDGAYRMLRVTLCSMLLVLSSGSADAFSLAKHKPHDILHQMGLAMGTAKCSNLRFNWLAHALVFDWAEAKLGEVINLERNKAPTIAGAEAADALDQARVARLLRRALESFRRQQYAVSWITRAQIAKKQKNPPAHRAGGFELGCGDRI